MGCKNIGILKVEFVWKDLIPGSTVSIEYLIVSPHMISLVLDPGISLVRYPGITEICGEIGVKLYTVSSLIKI